MNSIKKNRIKNNMRYMWPVYLVSAVVISIILNVIFGIVHKLPAYKTLTIFVSGEVTDSKGLQKDLLVTLSILKRKLITVSKLTKN